MRTGACDLKQTLVAFNITAPKIRLQPHRMAEPARTANIPAPHPIQPKPNSFDDKIHNPPKEVPPPPEKPEPDDCCGSGCVRCVWDVYYDKLEQYNKLYKQDDPNPKPS